MVTANNAGQIGGGYTIPRRWIEQITDKLNGRHEDRDPHEIVAEIAEKAGIIINHEHI